jgi:hypothetical protein
MKVIVAIEAKLHPQIETGQLWECKKLYGQLAGYA